MGEAYTVRDFEEAGLLQAWLCLSGKPLEIDTETGRRIVLSMERDTSLTVRMDGTVSGADLSPRYWFRIIGYLKAAPDDGRPGISAWDGILEKLAAYAENGKQTGT